MEHIAQNQEYCGVCGDVPEDAHVRSTISRCSEEDGGGCISKVLVFIVLDEKVGIKVVRKMQATMEDQGIRHCIAVFKHGITPFAKQGVASINRQGDIRIEYFKADELMVDITRHKCVPLHTVLSPKQQQEVIEKYEKNIHLYPKILLADPMARYLGLRSGTMIKVTRQYNTAGVYTTYRIAI